MENRQKEVDMQAVKMEIERLESTDLLIESIYQYDGVHNGYTVNEFNISEVANYDYQ